MARRERRPRRRRTLSFDQIAERITVEELAEAIGAERWQGGWRCPLGQNHQNGDRKPSLSFFYSSDRLLVKCHAPSCGLTGSPVQVYTRVHGCSPRRAARQLTNLVGNQPASNLKKAGREITKPATAKTTPDKCGQKESKVRSKIVEEYIYLDENNTPLFRVLRLSPKDFRQQRFSSEGRWISGLNGTRRVLYRLPRLEEAIRESKTIYIVEGEKDVHAIGRAGGIATTNPGGAGKWRDEYNKSLHGARVVIVADRDDAGRKHALSILEALTGIAESVVVVEPAVGKDASDHLSAGLGLDDFRPIEGGDPIVAPATSDRGNSRY